MDTGWEVDSMKEKILIIDDEVDICHVLKDLLEFEESDDYEVEYVTTAEDAFQRLGKNQYAVLFVDIKLGGTVSGIDIIKECRRLNPLPTVVVISALTRDALDPIFRREGIQDLIYAFYEKTETLTPQVIINLIGNLLKKREEGKS